MKARLRGDPFVNSFIDKRNEQSLSLGTDKYFFIGSTLIGGLFLLGNC